MHAASEETSVIISEELAATEGRSQLNILVVSESPSNQSFLAGALDDYTVSIASSGAEALETLALVNYWVVLVDSSLTDMTAMALIQQSAAQFPQTQRLLWAPYKELGTLIKSGAEQLVSLVLPKPGRAANIQRAVFRLLQASTVERELEHFDEDERYSPEMRAEKLLRWSTLRISHVRGTVVRPLPLQLSEIQLQFVLWSREVSDRLGHDLNRVWGAPLKNRDEHLPKDLQSHPVVQMLGKIWKSQEIYVRQFGNIYAYLLLLPWTKEPRTTIVLGLHDLTDTTTESKLTVTLHDLAVQERTDIFLPGSQDKQGYYSQEYDLIVTEAYVGPDRRTEQQTPINRYLFLGGKREHVSEKLAAVKSVYIDRMTKSSKALFVVYLFLSLLDAVFTHIFIKIGHVQELNPILRPLILAHPWLFYLVKNLLSLSAFFVLARFQLVKVAKYLIPFAVLLYFILDAYWFYLITSGIALGQPAPSG